MNCQPCKGFDGRDVRAVVLLPQHDRWRTGTVKYVPCCPDHAEGWYYDETQEWAQENDRVHLVEPYFVCEDGHGHHTENEAMYCPLCGNHKVGRGA